MCYHLPMKGVLNVFASQERKLLVLTTEFLEARRWNNLWRNFQSSWASLSIYWANYNYWMSLKVRKSRGEICPCRHCRRQCKIFTSGIIFSRSNALSDINESPKYILSCPWKTLVSFKVWNLWATRTHCFPWRKKIFNNLILGPSEQYYFGH